MSTYKRIIVAGGSGWLGSLMIPFLIGNGYEVVGLKRASSSDGHIKKLDRNIRFIDVDDRQLCEAHIKEFSPHLIIDAACFYLGGVEHISTNIIGNYEFPAWLLSVAIRCGCKSFLTIGTSLPEKTNLYSLTKKQFNELGKMLVNEEKINFTALLAENFYGIGEPEDRLIANTIKKLRNNEDVLLTKGFQTRDFTSVYDILDALGYIIRTDCSILNTSDSKNYCYCEIPVGTGESSSIREFITFLHTKLKSKSKLRFGAIPSRKYEPNTCADLTNLRKINYTKKFTSWRDGMQKLLERN